MNSLARRIAVVLALLISLGAAAEAVAARVRVAPRLTPVVISDAPRVGYLYEVIPGLGFRVIGVEAATPAAHMGLEIGDVVLAINGHRLTHLGADVPARIEAARRGGWVSLKIRDARTGRLAFRSANLFYLHHRIGQPVLGGVVVIR